MILEKVTGITYGEFLQQKIVNTLDLKHTGSACRQLPPGSATGHVPGSERRSIEPVPFNQAVPAGPGSIYSNVHDLYLWLRAVDTNAKFGFGDLAYPYGWGRRNISQHKFINQSGSVVGFNAYIALYPDEHVYAVLLSNVQSGFFNRIEKDLDTVLFGGQVSTPPDPKSVTTDPKELRGFVGEYKAGSIPESQVFSIQDGSLGVRWGEPFVRFLTPVAKDEFFVRLEYAKVRFERDQTGRVIRVVWQWPQGEPLSLTRVDVK